MRSMTARATVRSARPWITRESTGSFSKRAAEHDHQLKAKEGLGTRQDHPGLGQHLLDPGVQRRMFAPSPLGRRLATFCSSLCSSHV
jgi:hypothetical protein